MPSLVRKYNAVHPINADQGYMTDPKSRARYLISLLECHHQEKVTFSWPEYHICAYCDITAIHPEAGPRPGD
jgi:hypothetical protein